MVGHSFREELNEILGYNRGGFVMKDNKTGVIGLPPFYSYFIVEKIP